VLKLNLKARTWIKCFHIFFASAWVGAAICMVLLTLAKRRPVSGDEIYAVNASLKILDDYIIIPAALGSLLTGLLFSCFTNWGFFKFNWITVKWFFTVASILSGTFFLGPWNNTAVSISYTERLFSLDNPVYLHCKLMLSIFGVLQAAVLIFLVFISVLKPWGNAKQGRRAKKGSKKRQDASF